MQNKVRQHSDNKKANNRPRYRRPIDGKSHQTRKNRNTKSVNPKIKFDEYTSWARTAAASGDLIAAENLFQHAEHYYRLMNID